MHCSDSKQYHFKGTSGGRKCTIPIPMKADNFWSHVIGIPLNLYIFFKRTSNSDHFPFEMKRLCWPCRLYQLKLSCSFIIRDLSAYTRFWCLNLIGLTCNRIQFINGALSTQSGARFFNFWFWRKLHHFLWRICKFFTKNDIIFFKIKNSKIWLLIA